ncbi:hypothetical protein DFJ77DRAFT_101115 [Powellomyces hirtus]|nr:hypothetical protein DFJ77DRAFT_281791 [Powellomyces hirtus]KAI8910593.1 hypothetical protein DFJ77DRAFT_101115 [Powellomyces hirtus]
MLRASSASPNKKKTSKVSSSGFSPATCPVQKRPQSAPHGHSGVLRQDISWASKPPIPYTLRAVQMSEVTMQYMGSPTLFKQDSGRTLPKFQEPRKRTASRPSTAGPAHSTKNAWSSSPYLFIEPLSPCAAKNANPAHQRSYSRGSSSATLCSTTNDDGTDTDSPSQRCSPHSRIGTPDDKAPPTTSRTSSSTSSSSLTTRPPPTLSRPSSSSDRTCSSLGVMWIAKAEESLGWVPKKGHSVAAIYEVTRPAEEQEGGRERLNLSRRGLSTCLNLYQETRLRFLNYQNNQIVTMEHLNHLSNLVFLDFYNNQIEVISGLDALQSLRVLMLGRNKIKEIRGLEMLARLDVLDLHSNQICAIENLNHLRELRVLNLEDNVIRGPIHLAALVSISDMNLKRNQITAVRELCALENLRRLSLGSNEINSFEDIAAVLKSETLSELSLENNPICRDNTHRGFIINRMRSVKILDGRRVSEEERRAAVKLARKESERLRECERVATQKDERLRAMTKIRISWEREMGIVQQGDKEEEEEDGDDPPAPDLVVPHPPSARASRASSAGALRSSRTGPAGDIVCMHLSDSVYAELHNGCLTIYGEPSTIIDRVDPTSITSVCFNYARVTKLGPVMAKLKRFHALQGLTFSRNHLTRLKDVNHLSLLRDVQDLDIHADQNEAVSLPFFRQYVVFRLSHLPLRSLCGKPITVADVNAAEAMFGSLRKTIARLPSSTIWRTPDIILPLGIRISSEGSDDQSYYENALRARAAISSRSGVSASVAVREEFVRGQVKGMMERSVQANVRLRQFNEIWPLLVEEACVKGLIADSSGVED